MNTVTTDKKTFTDEELMQIQHEGKVEFVNGELRLMPPAGSEQGAVDVNVVTLLWNHVKRNKLGRVFDAQTGFRPRENLRSPDVAFVSRKRLPKGKLPKGFARFVPDLAVEVFATGERLRDYDEKLNEYFEWGVQLVWLVDPSNRTVTVCRPKDKVILGSDRELTGEEVVPGFRCRVSEFFE